MPLIVMLISLCCLGIVSGLRCSFGTSASYTNCTTTASQDSCIEAQFLNTNTTVYTCGDCSLYVNNTNHTSQVSCCSGADFCLNITAPLPSHTACDALTTLNECTNRSDCYWCDNSSFNGLGLCQALPLAYVPCWATPLFLPAGLCDSVQCQPAYEAYAVESLTLDYLNGYGFKPVTSVVGDLKARGVALDALSRFSGTRIMNDTYAFCRVDREIREWCGVDTWNPFEYCLIAESWPQSDAWGWVQNTSFTSNTDGLKPIYPSFCACNKRVAPGRAYYLPGRSIDNVQHYAPECGGEIVLVVFYCVLMAIFAVFGLFVFFDLGLIIVEMYKRARGHQHNRVTVQTLVMRVFGALYIVTSIASLAMFASPAGVNPTLSTGKAVMCFITVIALLGAYELTAFNYTALVLRSKIVGEARQQTTIVLFAFKWCLFAAILVLLLAAQGMTGGFAFYLQQTLTYSVSNLTELGTAGGLTARLAEAIMLILVSTQGLELLVVAVLLGILTYKFASTLDSVDLDVSDAVRDVIGRDVALLVATLMGLPNLGLLAILTVITTKIQTGLMPSYWASVYLSYIAYLWLIWAYFLTGLVWFAATAYSMNSPIINIYLMRPFMTLLGLKRFVNSTVVSVTSNSDGSGTVQTAVDDDDNNEAM